MCVCTQLDVRADLVVPQPMTETDGNGNPLTPAAWLHFNRHRVRCVACNVSFCAACRLTPYHLGYTCEQHQADLVAAHCRFCQEALTAANRAPPHASGAAGLLDCCSTAGCLERRRATCVAVTPGCGHPCNGLHGETNHLPCLAEDCSAEPCNADDFCNICFVESLGSAPCIKLTSCGHIFHAHCVLSKVSRGWPGVRITFGFMQCPLCKVPMRHPHIDAVVAPHAALLTALRAKAVARLAIEGMEADPKLMDPTSRYFGQRETFALESFAFYSCFKCKQPYFGGRRNCEQNADLENQPAEHFICFDCSPLPVNCSVAAHKEFILWKCRFCCSPAVWCVVAARLNQLCGLFFCCTFHCEGV